MNELPSQTNRDACLDRGLLVCLRDGELTPTEADRARAHLATCPDCAADARRLQADSQELYEAFTALGPSFEEIPDPASAFAAFQSRLASVGQHAPRDVAPADPAVGNVSRFPGARPLYRQRRWIAVAAAVLLAVIVVPNAHVLADQFLGLFQVQSFQPVTVNLQSFRDGVGEDLQHFGAFTVQAPNMNTITHPTLVQLKQELPFSPLLPNSLPSGVGPVRQFTLIDSSVGTFTFDATTARAYLAKTGQGNVAIPPQLDGATFTVTLAPGVIINYGQQCQTQTQNVTEFPPKTEDLGCSGGKPFYIAEIPSPVIRATGKASLEDLLHFVLSLPNLSPDARTLLRDVNLTNGVVPLPIPPQVQAQQVTTHRVKGVLMIDTSLSLGAVLWQTGGIVYMVAGAANDRAQLLASANSLR